jgi:hypothetical protein
MDAQTYFTKEELASSGSDDEYKQNWVEVTQDGQIDDSKFPRLEMKCFIAKCSVFTRPIPADPVRWQY